MADEKPTVTASERNLLDLGKIGLPSADQTTLREIITFKAVKVDVELIGPACDSELKSKAFEKQAKAGVKDVVTRYSQLIGKAANEHLAVVVEKFRADQGGDKKAYSDAESALSKLAKYIEKIMADFRVDLRENVAKRLGISAKEMMTVGSISTKESTINKGVFKSESGVDSRDEADESDLSTALKSKKWQYVGLASSTDTAKIVVNKKKPFKKEELKKSMDKLFDEGDRAGLKYYVGMLKAEGQTNLQFEFLSKSKPGSDPKTFAKRLKKGLKDQVSFNGHLEITPVDEFTNDSKSGEPTATTTKTKQTTTTTTK